MIVDFYSNKLLSSSPPWKKGKFTIGVGLKALGRERKALDFDELHPEYLFHKKKVREKEHFKDYFPHYSNISDEEVSACSKKIISLIPSNKSLEFKRFQVSDPRDSFDCVSTFLQEDVAIWKKNVTKEWLAAIHLCSPNHWSAKEKIGKSFVDVHKPVPHIDKVSKISLKIFDQCASRGIQERLAWGLSTDTILDHHPFLGTPGRKFDDKNSKLYVRLERQLVIPVNKYPDLLIFTIRTYFVDCMDLSRDDRELISQCVLSMDEELLQYKGLLGQEQKVVNFLLSV